MKFLSALVYDGLACADFDDGTHSGFGWICGELSGVDPLVEEAPSDQPWAYGRNPFGIERGDRAFLSTLVDESARQGPLGEGKPFKAKASNKSQDWITNRPEKRGKKVNRHGNKWLVFRS